jgi:hypothetical protein
MFMKLLTLKLGPHGKHGFFFHPHSVQDQLNKEHIDFSFPFLRINFLNTDALYCHRRNIIFAIVFV